MPLPVLGSGLLVEGFSCEVWGQDGEEERGKLGRKRRMKGERRQQSVEAEGGRPSSRVPLDETPTSPHPCCFCI